MPTFDEVLQRLRPGKSYVNPDNTLAGVLWEEGVTPPTQAEYDAAENAPPDTVTPLQMRRALNQVGKRADVEAYVAAANQDVKDAWEYGITMKIDDPLMVAAAAALNVDTGSLFALASTFPRYR